MKGKSAKKYSINKLEAIINRDHSSACYKELDCQSILVDLEKECQDRKSIRQVCLNIAAWKNKLQSGLSRQRKRRKKRQRKQAKVFWTNNCPEEDKRGEGFGPKLHGNENFMAEII